VLIEEIIGLAMLVRKVLKPSNSFVDNLKHKFVFGEEHN